MITDIDHIGIAVNNLDGVLETLKDAMGLDPTFEEHVTQQKVRVAGFKIGQSAIEYLEPTSPESPLTKFLEKR